MSRFAAVPTAALDDDRLEALHIRVLTALCSYGDKDGWCRVGQDLIAKRARTNTARVSQCIGDLADWGWVRRQRIEKMRVNVYQVLLDCDLDLAIPLPTEQEQIADTASHVTCRPSKSDVLPEQITVAEAANPIGTPSSLTVLNTAAATADERRAAMDRILGACGPRLADETKSATPRMKLAGRIGAWLTAYDVDQDIIPVLVAKTQRGSTLYDPTIFESDIAAHHAARMRPLAAVEKPHERTGTRGGFGPRTGNRSVLAEAQAFVAERESRTYHDGGSGDAGWPEGGGDGVVERRYRA
jgi:hypothetical protein